MRSRNKTYLSLFDQCQAVCRWPYWHQRSCISSSLTSLEGNFTAVTCAVVAFIPHGYNILTHTDKEVQLLPTFISKTFQWTAQRNKNASYKGSVMAYRLGWSQALSTEWILDKYLNALAPKDFSTFGSAQHAIAKEQVIVLWYFLFKVFKVLPFDVNISACWQHSRSGQYGLRLV